MNTKRFLIISAIICLVACRTISVTKATFDTGSAIGTIYRLPQTQLVFEIELKTTTYQKSPLACLNDYRQFFSGIIDKDLLDQLENSESVVTTKVNNAIISPLPVPDNGKIFTISTKNKFFNKHIYGLNLDDNGILNKGDFSSENQVVPVVSQLISSAAAFVSPFSASRSSNEVDDFIKNKDSQSTKESMCKDLFEKYREISASREQFVTLAPFKISTELPSKELYEKALTELDQYKESLFNQFMFTTDIRLDKVVIRFTPSQEDYKLVGGEILFGILKDKDAPKIYINKDLVGNASESVSSSGVTFESKTAKDIAAVSGIKLFYLKIVPDGYNKKQIEDIIAKPTPKVGTADNSGGGLYYNIPLSCKVYLQKGKENNWVGTSIMFPQWGGLGRLSDKNAKQIIELNPLYGNLRSVQSETHGATPSDIKTFGESLSQARDVFYTDPVTKMERRIKYLQTKTNLSAAEGSELAELQKQIELLKAQKELMELRKAIKDFEL